MGGVKVHGFIARSIEGNGFKAGHLAKDLVTKGYVYLSKEPIHCAAKFLKVMPKIIARAAEHNAGKGFCKKGYLHIVRIPFLIDDPNDHDRRPPFLCKKFRD